MDLKTEAIVLNTVKYAENSIILNTYTEQKGKLVFFINSLKNKKSSLRPALIQPFSILNLDISYNPKKEIHHIKDAKIAHHFSSIPFDPIKTSISIFLAEILFKSLKEEEQTSDLYQFIKQSIVFFDEKTENAANFHLLFLLKLSYFLGFSPNVEPKTKYFDLLNGTSCSQMPLHKHFLNEKETDFLKELLQLNYETMHMLKLSRREKIEMINHFINYYRFHLADFGKINSLQVLQTLFD